MNVSIVGAGVSGIFCAYHLVKSGVTVNLFEKETSIAKKFLIAGKSGLNITSSYPMSDFHNMYFENAHLFKRLIADYNPADTIKWLEELGFETFEGSSHKVFPKEFKAAKILKKIKDFLLSSNFCFIHTGKELIDFDNEFLFFKDNSKYTFDYSIFALGGGSWSKTGSSGEWLKIFDDKLIRHREFLPSNCGFKTNININMRLPLKNIALSFGEKTLKGEALLFNNGIEGGVIYHFSSLLRTALSNETAITISIDFKPSMSLDQLIEKLMKRRSKDSWSKHIKKMLNLDKDIMNLIKSTLSKDEYFNVITLGQKIKSFEISLSMNTEMDKAISTAGGVKFSEVSTSFRLLKYPNIYISGEMLDWEAPTGGFLIQGCYSISYRILRDILVNGKN